MTKYELIFSPTGGTKKVAQLLTAGWPEASVQTIDLTDKDLDFAQMGFGQKAFAPRFAANQGKH